jgi:predicted DCC family thiol-disulfide oxidoreductase YuxK
LNLPADHLILFDGVCGFCTRGIQLLFRYDRRGRLHFAPLQSDLGRQICMANGLDPETFDTFIFARPNQPILVRSDAALAVASTLGFPWSLLTIFRIIPRRLRDAAYDLIARNRLRFLGRRESCYIPTPAERARFHE